MSTEETKTARVHRFHETVALYFRRPEGLDGGTVYLSAALARQLSEELSRYARDIDAHSFTSSQLGTINLDGIEKPRGDAQAEAMQLLETLENGNRRDVREALSGMPSGRAAVVAGYMMGHGPRENVLRLLDSIDV